jgi:cyclophilin family peptidyl-prolyl cis-trans isomerase
MNKILKKTLSATLALTSVFACATTMTACESSNPEVTMTVSFNNETYKLEYKLYRKTNPATTKHFLWLVEEEFYNGLCIHNYDANNSRMYTGGYEVAKEESDKDGLTARDYFDFVKNSENLSAFPHSVWKYENKTNPLYTLRGEFEKNYFEVQSGAIKQSFGSLSMYYSAKTTTDRVYVPYDSGEENETTSREYKYNSATSLFYINLKTTESTNTEYCTFATLKGGSVSKLEALQEAIAEYIEDNYDDAADFTNSKTLNVDYNDLLLEDYSKNVSYNVPKTPIVIESIKVSKY